MHGTGDREEGGKDENQAKGEAGGCAPGQGRGGGGLELQSKKSKSMLTITNSL